MKGSKWGSRVVRNRVADGTVEVLCKLMREGLDQKLDLWLETGHFQLLFLIDGFLPDKSCTLALSTVSAFGRPLCYVSTKHVPRVIAAHGMEAALHVNHASGRTFNDAVREAPPETRSSEGGGVWAEYDRADGRPHTRAPSSS